MMDDPRLIDYLVALKARREAVARKLEDIADEGKRAAEVRKITTRHDPLAFALTYLAHHLIGEATGNELTLAEVHWHWVEAAKDWERTLTEPYESRRAEVGPREVGKSTWWFLLLPMWAAAHGHVKFVAAFANTPAQAETHLASFKAELDANVNLRNDYPDLVAPKTRGRGTTEADRVSLYHAKSGFVFSASGMDSANLGLKVGNKRPDVIILDDIEPHEANYSPRQATKRLGTLQDSILPLNIFARVVAVGTVTMTDSIIHQLVKSAQGGKAPDWVTKERFAAHHYPAIINNDDGTRRSVWPAKWALEFLESIEGTRSYAKNYANDPIGADGDYWRAEDFHRAELDKTITRIVVSVDPNVTQKESSDYTGLAVVGWSPSRNKCQVLHASQVKVDPAKLRLMVIDLILDHGAGLVLVEVNQGGELWNKIFWGMPVKVKTLHQSVKKEVRAAGVLNLYQRHRVEHVGKLDELEGQMAAFPNAPHDDMVDAVGSGVALFLMRPKVKKPGVVVETASYA